MNHQIKTATIGSKDHQKSVITNVGTTSQVLNFKELDTNNLKVILKLSHFKH